MHEKKIGIDDEMRKLVKKFRMTWKNYESALDRSLVDAGIYKSQFLVLVNVFHQDRISQVELAKSLDISAPSVAVTVKKLVNMGYITRVMDEHDNRINLLSITQTGKEKLYETWDGFIEVDKKLFFEFSKEEREVFSSMLDRICSRLEELKDEQE